MGIRIYGSDRPVYSYNSLHKVMQQRAEVKGCDFSECESSFGFIILEAGWVVTEKEEGAYIKQQHTPTIFK
jgi:hypothetical protein